MKLSKRLQAIADFIEDGAAVADIGTDHGFIPVYLALKGTAGNIIASDISASSLAAARRSAADKDVTEAITFIVTPGLDGIDLTQIDTIVIAGVGGETILRIIENSLLTSDNGIKLILQPQSKIDILLRFLYDSGYEIRQTKTVHDKGKNYTVLLVTGDANRKTL